MNEFKPSRQQKRRLERHIENATKELVITDSAIFTGMKIIGIYVNGKHMDDLFAHPGDDLDKKVSDLEIWGFKVVDTPPKQFYS